MRTRSLTLLTAAFATTALVAGCSSTVDGDAQAPVTTSASASTTLSDDEIQAALFSPCDDIPDDALRKTGVDPATEDPEVFGVEFTGWRVCGWDATAGWYYLTVFATTHTFDEVQNKSGNIEFTPVDIGNRQAATYRQVNDPERTMCDVAIASNQGAYLIRAERKASKKQLEDSCVLAIQHARDLIPLLPN